MEDGFVEQRKRPSPLEEVCLYHICQLTHRPSKAAAADAFRRLREWGQTPSCYLAVEGLLSNVVYDDGLDIGEWIEERIRTGTSSLLIAVALRMAQRSEETRDRLWNLMATSNLLTLEAFGLWQELRNAPVSWERICEVCKVGEWHFAPRDRQPFLIDSCRRVRAVTLERDRPAVLDEWMTGPFKDPSNVPPASELGLGLALATLEAKRYDLSLTRFWEETRYLAKDKERHLSGWDDFYAHLGEHMASGALPPDRHKEALDDMLNRVPAWRSLSAIPYIYKDAALELDDQVLLLDAYAKCTKEGTEELRLERMRTLSDMMTDLPPALEAIMFERAVANGETSYCLPLHLVAWTIRKRDPQAFKDRVAESVRNGVRGPFWACEYLKLPEALMDPQDVQGWLLSYGGSTLLDHQRAPLWQAVEEHGLAAGILLCDLRTVPASYQLKNEDLACPPVWKYLQTNQGMRSRFWSEDASRRTILGSGVNLVEVINVFESAQQSGVTWGASPLDILATYCKEKPSLLGPVTEYASSGWTVQVRHVLCSDGDVWKLLTEPRRETLRGWFRKHPEQLITESSVANVLFTREERLNIFLGMKKLPSPMPSPKFAELVVSEEDRTKVRTWLIVRAKTERTDALRWLQGLGLVNKTVQRIAWRELDTYQNDSEWLLAIVKS